MTGALSFMPTRYMVYGTYFHFQEKKLLRFVVALSSVLINDVHTVQLQVELLLNSDVAYHTSSSHRNKVTLAVTEKEMVHTVYLLYCYSN